MKILGTLQNYVQYNVVRYQVARVRLRPEKCKDCSKTGCYPTCLVPKRILCKRYGEIILDIDPPKKSGARRIGLLIIIGVALILGGAAFRNSSWSHERFLKTLDLESLSLAVHDSPNDPLTFLYYGSELLQAGKPDQSLSAFQQAIKLDPKSSRAFLGEATSFSRLGRGKEAYEAFEQSSKLDPKDPAPLLGMSQTLFQAGNPHRAIEPMEKLTLLKPKDANAWYSLARLYGEDRRSDDAMKAIKKAVELDPKKAEYWRDMAQLSRRYGKNADAEQQLIQALHLNGKDPIGHFWLGQLYAQMAVDVKYYGRAEQEFLAAISRDPSMQEAYFELGKLYESRKNYPLAISNLRTATELDSSDEKALYHLGLCLKASGEVAESVKLIKGAQMLEAAKKEISTLQNRILSDPSKTELHLRLARVFRKYENYEGASSEYQVYLTAVPSDKIAIAEAEALQKQLQEESGKSAPIGSSTPSQQLNSFSPLGGGK